MYVARPELGTKRLCVGCAARFYDLSRVPARCPTCGVDQPPPRARTAPIPRGPGTRWPSRTAPAPVIDPVEAVDDTLPLIDVPDETDDDDDDEDVAEVVPPDEET